MWLHLVEVAFSNALFQEAGEPPADVAAKVNVDSGPWRTGPSRQCNGPRSRTRDVCFTPKSGHAQRPSQCPLSATSGLRPIGVGRVSIA